MPKLIEQILENSNNIKIKSVSCDGPMIVMRISNIFKRKGFGLQSR